MDQIILRDLLAYGVLGVYEWERQAPRPVLINVTLFVDLQAAGESDDLEDSLNYAEAAQALREHVAQSQRYTIEALASDLAKLCLEMPGVQKVRLRLEKPGAIAYAASAGVEIERERSA